MKPSNILRLSVLVTVLIATGPVLGQSSKVQAPDHLVMEELAYTGSDSSAQTLIIAYPKAIKKHLPAVIHIHGGGFRHGKASEKTAILFAENGFGQQ